ncbi:MAG: ROK family protein [Aeromicrobium sp.]
MLIVSHGAQGPPTARVLSHVRRGGVVMREDLVESTGLSAPTVSRAVTALVDARLVRLRPDMGRVGATGRPSIPLQLDSRSHAVIGIHVGLTRTTIARVDLRGRVLESAESATPAGLDDLVALLGSGIGVLRAHDRLIVSVAIVAAWTDLGLDRAALASRVGDGLGVVVATADHITAAAAAEHAVGSRGAGATTAYVYARDTIGFAVVEEGATGSMISRSSRLTHFPSGSQVPCRCRAVGCLEATASDRALGLRAYAEGLVEAPDVTSVHCAAAAGSVRAQALLVDRAATLGRAAAFVRDMVASDRVVLVGQGFTATDGTRADVLRSFEQATTLPPAEVSFGHHGSGLQAVAAGAIALLPLDEDPIGLISSLPPAACAR